MTGDVSTLTTARLTLRPRQPSDLEDCLAMDSEPAVQRYVWPDGIADMKAHRAKLLERMLDGWPPQGGYWIVEWRGKPGFLGWCGLFPLEESGLIEIGYRYRSAAWGQGVATEAATAVLDHGFRVLGFDPIVAVTNPENDASQKVLTKIGLQRSGMAFHYGQELTFFTLDRDRYLANHHR